MADIDVLARDVLEAAVAWRRADEEEPIPSRLVTDRLTTLAYKVDTYLEALLELPKEGTVRLELRLERSEFDGPLRFSLEPPSKHSEDCKSGWAGTPFIAPCYCCAPARKRWERATNL